MCCPTSGGWRPTPIFGDQPWHGDAGPIPVSRYPSVGLSEAGAAGLAALEAAGFPLIEDHNRPGAVGVARMPMNSRDGVRVTTADAYLPAGGTPPNLTILPGAQVADVMFEGTRATGVRLLGGLVIEAGWVVLCAGTYGSPAVLMRSGIGPAGHLRTHGIGVRADLPGVGANLADHGGVDIDCGYAGPARAAPVFHLLATFHSSAMPGDEAPDLMLWLSDPRGDRRSSRSTRACCGPAHEAGCGCARPIPPSRRPSSFPACATPPTPSGWPRPTCAGSTSPATNRSGAYAPDHPHPTRAAPATCGT
jgi:choline dehydrogenase-like flavoprotein